VPDRIDQRWLHSGYTGKWELTIGGGGGAWDNRTGGRDFSTEGCNADNRHNQRPLYVLSICFVSLYSFTN